MDPSSSFQNQNHCDAALKLSGQFLKVIDESCRHRTMSQDFRTMKLITDGLILFLNCNILKNWFYVA